MPAYPPPAWLGNTTSWGGSVLRAPGAAAAGEYHMYLAEMAGGCGMETWTTNSIIRHAVSSSGPAGPYQPREVIMQPFAHNPTAIRAPDGTYLIYHIGCGTPVGSRCADCTGGFTSPTCHAPGEEVACNGNTTNILYSKSPDGPWQQLNAPIVKSATVSPAAPFGFFAASSRSLCRWARRTRSTTQPSPSSPTDLSCCWGAAATRLGRRARTAG